MDLELVQKEIEADLNNALSLASLEEVRIKFLGRKGLVAELTSTIPTVIPSERGIFGQKVNALKNKILSLIAEKELFLKSQVNLDKKSNFDIGLPGIAPELGGAHPITQAITEICNIFKAMGFSVVSGPEVETEYNNFTGLNIPLEHPSRDAFDTFYLKKYTKLLLRSHTSPVQVRTMQAFTPPLAVIVPGRVYRPDAVDASHLFMFHQIEGFVVGENIKFSDLKGSLEFFAKNVFGQNIKMRFRPHFFPFTEPSVEVDISCIICQGQGCSVCGKKGWLEILGAGLIHPNVFKQVGYPAGKYTGFAFGMGIERIAMLKHGINDIRLFFENDLRFLKQF